MGRFSPKVEEELRILGGSFPYKIQDLLQQAHAIYSDVLAKENDRAARQGLPVQRAVGTPAKRQQSPTSSTEGGACAKTGGQETPPAQRETKATLPNREGRCDVSEEQWPERMRVSRPEKTFCQRACFSSKPHLSELALR